MGNREEGDRKFREVESDDHVMTLEEFSEAVNSGFLIDYDGFGYLVKDNKAWVKPVYPSDWPFIDKEDFTHVVWYNR